MGETMKITAVLLGALVLIYTLGFLATGGDLAIYRFWAPRRANAERVVFENTQSYVQGKVEYLNKLRFQYQDDPRPALRMMILTESSTVDNNNLPLDLQGFIQNLKENR
jgi:hypothetical protein